jgi:hypothetical protein
MSDPFRGPPGTNPPRHVREPRDGTWMGVAIALAIVVGLGAWALTHGTKTHGTKTERAPGVTASPAPATGEPAPQPRETTGQAAPRTR